MKRIAIFLIIITIVLSALCFAFFEGGEVLRLHVVANSDDDFDQSVKKEIVNLVNAFIAENEECAKNAGYEKTTDFIAKQKALLEEKISAKLKELNASYGADIRLDTESFPARSYRAIYFDSGEYNALVVTLGKGEGDNWWCVLYPRLCYGKSYGERKIVYKSRIVEIYEKLVNEHKQGE